MEPSLVGATIGSWVVKQVLGAGGMGALYLAEHTAIGHKAAIKIAISPPIRKRPSAGGSAAVEVDVELEALPGGELPQELGLGHPRLEGRRPREHRGRKRADQREARAAGPQAHPRTTMPLPDLSTVCIDLKVARTEVTAIRRDRMYLDMCSTTITPLRHDHEPALSRDAFTQELGLDS